MIDWQHLEHPLVQTPCREGLAQVVLLVLLILGRSINQKCPAVRVLALQNFYYLFYRIEELIFESLPICDMIPSPTPIVTSDDCGRCLELRSARVCRTQCSFMDLSPRKPAVSSVDGRIQYRA